MFSAQFDYYRAASVDEARRLLKDHPGAKLLAGGHSLIPLMKLRLARPEAVVDIGRIEALRGIRLDGDTLRIGALVTHAELASSGDVARTAAALADAAGQVGDPQVRNRGTIGGNVAHADPASDLPTVLLAADARFATLGSRGERLIPAAEFFQGMMATALEPDEVLTAILIPVRRGERSAYAKFAHPASRYAVVGAAAFLTMKDGTCSAARIAVGGLVPRPTRAPSVESAIAGKRLTADAIDMAAQRVTADVGADLLGDLYASADFRRSVAPVYVRRAIARAAADERG